MADENDAMSKLKPEYLGQVCPELFGLKLDAARLDALIPELEGILHEIKKLRELDLTEEHPVVVFDPMTVYRDSQS